MKVLFAHQTLGQFGGAETNIQLVAEELARRGCRSDLLHVQTSGRNESGWRQLFEHCFRVPPDHKTEFVQRALQNGNHDLIYLHNLGDLEVMGALLDSGLPVVRMIHDHSLYCMRTYKYNYFTRTICTRRASPYCVVPCLASIARGQRGGFPLRWVSYLDKRREMELNQRCRHLIVYSDYQKEELVRNGFAAEQIVRCAPIRMLGEGGQSSSFSQRNLILYAGQLLRGKGVDVLLKALSQVRTDFECLIFGDGNYRKHCEALSRTLGLQERVRFRGYTAPAELERYYREATVFVMSSLWPEPFGMAGPEAMRYGVPVVAFDAGGIREWLIDGENGYLVPWRNVRVFADRITELLRDKARARQLGRRAQERVRMYDSGSQIAILYDLFETLVGNQPNRRNFASIPQQNAVCL